MRNCGDCGAKPGQFHTPGCDMERCPMCGGQSISCHCIYVENGMDPDRLEETHPEIYVGGPTKEMEAVWDAKWAAKRIPWSGEYPGSAECREYGFWCVGPPWVSVPAGTPGATEDLNRLYGRETVWDVEKQKRVLVKR